MCNLGKAVMFALKAKVNVCFLKFIQTKRKVKNFFQKTLILAFVTTLSYVQKFFCIIT